MGYVAAVTAPTVDQAARAGRNLVAGVLLGPGHRRLHRRDRVPPAPALAPLLRPLDQDVGLVSDGLFHAFSWFATVASLFLVADLRRERAFWGRRFLAGWLAGAGFFQLYDGLVQHKLFGLHQIRFTASTSLPYDTAWTWSSGSSLLASRGWR